MRGQRKNGCGNRGGISQSLANNDVGSGEGKGGEQCQELSGHTAKLNKKWGLVNTELSAESKMERRQYEAKLEMTEGMGDRRFFLAV